MSAGKACSMPVKGLRIYENYNMQTCLDGSKNLFPWLRYLEDRDSPMKISFKLLTGRRLGLWKVSCSVPVPRKSNWIGKRTQGKKSRKHQYNSNLTPCLHKLRIEWHWRKETGSDKHAEWVVLFKLSMEVKRWAWLCCSRLSCCSWRSTGLGFIPVPSKCRRILWRHSHLKTAREM